MRGIKGGGERLFFPPLVYMTRLWAIENKQRGKKTHRARLSLGQYIKSGPDQQALALFSEKGPPLRFIRSHFDHIRQRIVCI